MINSMLMIIRYYDVNIVSTYFGQGHGSVLLGWVHIALIRRSSLLKLYETKVKIRPIFRSFQNIKKK